MKKMVLCVLVTILSFSLTVSAYAWSDSTPPTTSNTGSLTSSGTTVGFGTKGIKSSIDTSKCYNGISEYKMKASNLYLDKNSTSKCTVTFRVDYWNSGKEAWQAGTGTSTYTKLLPATNVKDKSGKYQSVKQSIAAQSLDAQGIRLYHYGIFLKDKTTRMFGSFTLSK